MRLCLFIICCPFEVIYFQAIPSTTLMRWAIPQSAHFKISYWKGSSNIFSFCVPFLIITRTPSIYRMVVIFWIYFFNSYFQGFVLILLNIYFWLIGYYLLALIYQLESVFSLKNLDPISSRWLFLFSSVCIAKSITIQRSSVSVNNSGCC